MPGLILKFLMMRIILTKLVFIFSCFSALLSADIAGQEPAVSESELLAAHFVLEAADSKQEITFLLPRSDRFTARYNPVTLTFSGLMYIYQRFISPQLPSECLYHPSCSSFSKSLIREYGLVRGLVGTADRLIRCNRVAAMDIHPLMIIEQSGKVHEQTDIYGKQKK